jgi:hypothetical protein
MSIVIEQTGEVKQGERKIAQIRQDGVVCDIRRHGNGFLYSGGYSVAVNEELLESLPDTTILQFTNLDTRDIYTCTVYDFRHWAEPWLFGTEKQRKVEIVRMNHTVEGKPKKKRINELHHVDTTPVPEYKQPSLFG